MGSPVGVRVPPFASEPYHARKKRQVKIDVEKPADWQRRLKITVPAERVDQERREVATQIAKRVRLPGFRKGKVPGSVVERHYSASIDQQTIERVVNEAYQEALKEQGFDPISQASVENVSYEPGSEMSFDVAFEVRPEISLERLGGFTLKQPPVVVGDEDVQRVLTRLQDQNATWSRLEEGKPAEGDRVEVEITPLQGESEAEPEPRKYEVVLGAGEILEEIDQAIRTLEAGGEGDFKIALPRAEEEGEKDEHEIHLKLLSAERPERPEMDDAFAKEVGGFDTMEELTQTVRSDLEQEATRESERDLRRQLMQQVLEANPFEAPPSLIDQYLDGLLQAPEGTDPGEMEQAKQQMRPAAEYGVRRMMVLDRVAELENLSATQNDLDARVQEIASSNDMEPAEVRRQLARSGRLEALARDLTEERVFDYLKSLSTIERDGA